jgi:NAD(P)-dependent dehydrogenase (short-subunit alcohol dehydrogenase family)
MTVRQAFLQMNAKVYLAARNEEHARNAIAELLIETGKEAIWLELDLSSFKSIEKAAAEFHRCVPIHRVFVSPWINPGINH